MAEVIKGAGSLESALPWRESRDWVILSGQSSFEKSGAADVLAPLLRSGAPHLVVKGPLPTTDEADRLVGEIGPMIPAGILAVGGGLVIDTMKVVARSLVTRRSAADLLEPGETSEQGEIFTVAAPTTAGSGAERTPFAVIYHGGVKHSLDDPTLLPSLAVIDPDLSRSAPRNVAAAAALDAMAHCVESLWACASTGESRAIALAALSGIMVNMVPAVVDGSRTAQDMLMFHASDAGEAIAVTRTTAAHALSYHLTSEYGVAHGHAVALTLGKLAVINAGVSEDNVSDVRGVDHVRTVLATVCSVFGVSDAESVPTRIEALLTETGLATDVDAAAGRHVERGRWLSHVNKQRLSNNPRRLGEEDLGELVGSP